MPNEALLGLETLSPVEATTRRLPGYRLNDAGAWEAVFPSGRVVAVEPGRSRAYPLLASACPSTVAFYQALSEVDQRATSVIDVGCGSGQGTAQLCTRFERVVGIDSFEPAVEFARCLVPEATFVHHGLTQVPPVAQTQLAIVADVLGHSRLPTQLLHSLRAVMAPDGLLLVAEPRAHIAHALQPPARYAFSRKSLERTLLYSGYVVRSWLADNSFLSCVAGPALDTSWQSLRAAQEALLGSDATEAIAHFQAAREGQLPSARLESWLGEGMVRLALGDGERASSCFLTALEFDNGEARALTNLARVSLRTGDPAQALGLAAQAVKHEPTNAEALALLGCIADSLKQQHEAIRSLALAHQLDPSSAEIATELARIAADQGDYDCGIAAFERLRSFGDDLGADFHLTFGWLLLAADRLDDARLEARMALLLAPEDSDVAELWAAVQSPH